MVLSKYEFEARWETQRRGEDVTILTNYVVVADNVVNGRHTATQQATEDAEEPPTSVTYVQTLERVVDYE